MLSAVVVLVAYALVRFSQSMTVSQGLYAGVLWLCLTLGFEFGFGRYVQHKHWSELFEAYTFQGGNLWLLVLLVTLLAPFWLVLIQSKSKHARSDA